MEEINLKKLIAEAREIAESLDEFADKLEKIEMAKELDELHNEYADKLAEPYAELLIPYDPDKYLYSDNGFPHFMEEFTEDDLEKMEGKK